MTIAIRDLVPVSNNSIITGAVAAALDRQLTDKEKYDFVAWLKIVESKINTTERNSRRRF